MCTEVSKMETVHGKYEQKNFGMIANGQIRLPVKLDLKTVAKKVLGTTASCFIIGAEKGDTDVRVNGKVTTRVIFIDEFDGFNSEEHTDEFSEKFTPKNLESLLSVLPSANIIQTANGKYTKNESDMIASVQTEHVINIDLTGLTKKEITYVDELRGDVESIGGEVTVQTYGTNLFEKFEIGESFALDQNIEGVLGVELSAHIREISCQEGRFAVKGVACISAYVVKSVDLGQTIANIGYEFDFSKTFSKKEINAADIVCGNVVVSNLDVKVENRATAELVVEAELTFIGNTLTKKTIKTVTDAFSCSNELNFIRDTASETVSTSQTNITSDIEGNMTMPEGSPFISKVLVSNLPSISEINIKPEEDKVILEGVLTANMIYECEEHNIHSYSAQIPFSVGCKIDGCTPAHNIMVSMTPLNCNIKARRGRELLVDARLAINVSANLNNEIQILSDITLGAPKANDDHAFTVLIAEAGETLWNIAKSVSIPTAEIIRQNPSIEHGISDGERIVLYKQQPINF